MPKINRALTWIRKALLVTQKTSAPVGFDDHIRPVIDSLGWERVGLSSEIVVRRSSATNNNTVAGAAVPDDVIRVILEAHVETTNNLLAFDVWITHRDAEFALDVAVSRVQALPISGIRIEAAALRAPIVLRPGDSLVGRCSPGTGVAAAVRLVERFVDIPTGEYIPYL